MIYLYYTHFSIYVNSVNFPLFPIIPGEYNPVFIIITINQKANERMVVRVEKSKILSSEMKSYQTTYRHALDFCPMNTEVTTETGSDGGGGGWYKVAIARK